MRKIELSIILLIVWLIIPSFLNAEVSVNVPVGHWSYDSIEKLISLDLIHSSLQSTKPFTRLEMARLTREASSCFQKYLDENPSVSNSLRTRVIRAILRRLNIEFRSELKELGGTDWASTYIKPIEDVYVKYLGSNNDFTLENDRGQGYGEGANVRAGFSSHGVIARHLAWYINPEYRHSKDQFHGDNNDLTLVEGYGKLQFNNLELEGGRDSLWWGPGYHGSLILTNNAKPFDLVKLSNPKPIVLPWFLRRLGLFKFAVFWTRLESNRYVPEPELLGMRVNIKPFPFLELGAARTIMLGGKGDNAPKGTSDLGLKDWIKVLSGKNISGSLDTNQIAGADFRLHIGGLARLIHFAGSLDFWGELYGEDEAANLPSRNGYILGLRLGDILLNGKTDLVVEHADNVIRDYPGLWYNHHVYKSGYTYRGRVMGHEMGTDARDFLISVRHFITPSIIAAVDYNHQNRGVQVKSSEEVNRYTAHITWHAADTTLMNAGFRHENANAKSSSTDKTTNIFWIGLNYSF